jgi:hypothetical protein
MDPESPDNILSREIEDLARHYCALLEAVNGSAPVASEELWDELMRTQQALEEAQARQREQHQREQAERVARESADGTIGTFLGLETTGLVVNTALRLDPVPTGIYHLLDPATHPLLTVTVRNEEHEPRRVGVTAYLEGLSAREIRTDEIGRVGEEDGEKAFDLLPSLLPGRARRITQVQRATLHVVVEIFGSTREKARTTWSQLVESHNTLSVVMLSRNSSFNGVIDPQAGLPADLFPYYGAWVTPHIQPIQALLRRAADLVPERQIWGYQGDDETIVTRQVRALFEALKAVGISYVNSIVDIKAGPRLITQRTRLPRESLKHRNANCIDGTVLFASLLESASLHAAIVIVPGHAFVAWEKWRGRDDWDYLETTMIGTHDFDAANARGREHHAYWSRLSRERLLKLNDLRAEGIWPME